MAALVLTNAQILTGTAFTTVAPGLPGTQVVAGTITSAVDISTYCTNVAVNVKAAMLDITNFGSGGYHAEIPGLKTGQVGLNFLQDYAAAALDAIVRTTLGGLGALIYVDVKATNAARAVTNPSFVFAAYIADYTFITGNVGALNLSMLPLTPTGAFAWLTA